MTVCCRLPKEKEEVVSLINVFNGSNVSIAYADVSREVAPLWVVVFDESYFPRPFPTFQLLLPAYGALECRKAFKVNKLFNVVAACESFDSPRLMLCHAPYEVVGNADVQGAVAPACKDINVCFVYVHCCCPVCCKYRE